MAKDSPVSTPFICKPTNPEPTPSPPPTWVLTLWPIIPLPQSPSRPSTRQSGRVPMPQNPMKLFIVADPKLAYSYLTFPSCWNHKKASDPCFPHILLASWLTLVLFHVALHGNACSYTWDLWLINYFLKGNCVLICWPHHTWVIIKPMF